MRILVFPPQIKAGDTIDDITIPNLRGKVVQSVAIPTDPSNKKIMVTFTDDTFETFNDDDLIWIKENN